MHNVLSGFPDRDNLPEWHKSTGNSSILNVNSHIHTPYSFSAFDDLGQLFRKAADEQVSVIGINDFNTTEGFSQFYELSLRYKIFPLFNIEFMGLLKDEQKRGIRINDSKNPGRIYFCGKGLDFPVSWGEESKLVIERITDQGHQLVMAMIERLNQHLDRLGTGMNLDFREVRTRYTQGILRERHIARALCDMILDRFKTGRSAWRFIRKLYGNIETGVDLRDKAALESEIRDRLLKSGGVAFVEEDPGTFLNLTEIMELISDGGGIPCYPLLLDDSSGNFTEFESDMEALCMNLKSWGVSSVELIPGRNDINTIKKFVNFFSESDFVILFGTEHNSPSMDPLKVSARSGVPLDEELREISYLGACVIAAHQYLRAKGEKGYDSVTGGEIKEKKKEFEELGKAVIDSYLRL